MRMKRPFESWLWMFVLGGVGSGVVYAVYYHVQAYGWGPWGILGVGLSFFCFYLMFYEWEHPLS